MGSRANLITISQSLSLFAYFGDIGCVRVIVNRVKQRHIMPCREKVRVVVYTCPTQHRLSVHPVLYVREEESLSYLDGMMLFTNESEGMVYSVSQAVISPRRPDNNNPLDIVISYIIARAHDINDTLATYTRVTTTRRLGFSPDHNVSTFVRSVGSEEGGMRFAYPFRSDSVLVREDDSVAVATVATTSPFHEYDNNLLTRIRDMGEFHDISSVLTTQGRTTWIITREGNVFTDAIEPEQFYATGNQDVEIRHVLEGVECGYTMLEHLLVVGQDGYVDVVLEHGTHVVPMTYRDQTGRISQVHGDMVLVRAVPGWLGVVNGDVLSVMMMNLNPSTGGRTMDVSVLKSIPRVLGMCHDSSVVIRNIKATSSSYY